MTSRFSLGVRGKFVLVALFSLACTVGVTLLYLPEHQASVIESGARTKILQICRLGANSLAEATASEDSAGASRMLSSLEELPEIEGVQIYLENGGLLAEAGTGLHVRVRSQWLDRPHLEVVERDSDLVILVPIETEGQQRVGTLIAFGTLRFVRGTVVNEHWMLIVVVSVSILIGVVVALYFANYITSPLFALQNAAARVEEGDFDVELPVVAQDEIGQLTTAFNRMAEYLKRTVISRNALSREVLERKRAYERIKNLKEKAEEAARIKSEFVANMSHEIRTPMNAIIGMTDLAIENEENPDQRECLELVNSAADSLMTIVNDILDFSKIEAGKIQLDPTDFDLPELLGRTLRTVGVRADQKELELYCDLADDVPRHLQQDPVRLQQILINLLGNAVKFTDSGEIAVKVRHESSEGGQVMVRFSVIDTGIGIAPSRQKRIFEAFSQADGSTTRRYGGTGLGLSISHQLVEMMNGEISVESELGKGSRFEFTIPFAIGNGPEDREPSQVSSRSVWIVDDHANVRQIFEAGFVRAGWEVTGFESGMEASAAFAEGRQVPELLVVDYRMPEQDGLEFISTFRQRHPDCPVEIVLMKRSGDLKVVSESCATFGVARTVNKPILAAALVRAVGEIFEAPTAAKPASLVEPTLKSDKNERILLAEDNPVNQKLAQRLLEKRGFDVVVAENGVAAIELWQEGSFDLILMDVQMPEMGGLEATERIRDHERRNGLSTRTPIVAMTANAMADDQVACREAGMDGYVAKPVKAATLYEEIDLALMGGTGIPRADRLSSPGRSE